MSIAIRFWVLPLLAIPAAYTQSPLHYYIQTIAGAGNNIGDGGPSLQALFRTPGSLAFDSSGRLLVADTGQHRIRRIDTGGTITTVAGTGDRGTDGDDGLAVDAKLWEPRGVAVTADGSILIGDGSARIRKIGLDGRINTVAGNGREGWSGDGGPAIEASIGIPGGIAIDSAGNIYVSDVLRSLVRKISSGGLISTVAGTGTAGFSGDGGPAAGAQLFAPLGLTINHAGNLLIADYGNLRIREILPDRTIRTVAGGGQGGDGGPATAAFLGYPCAVTAQRNGVLYVSESGSRIRRVDAAGVIDTIAGPDAAPAGKEPRANLSAESSPCGLVLDGKGGLIVAEGGNNRLSRIDVASPPLATTPLAGRNIDNERLLEPKEAQFFLPQGLSAGPTGDLVFADTEGHRVYRITNTGQIAVVAGTGKPGFFGDGGVASLARLSVPSSTAVDRFGNIWIADSLNRRIRKVSTSNVITTVASGESPNPAERISIPTEIAVDSAGNVYFTELNQHTVRKIDPSGKVHGFAGGVEPGFSGDGGPALESKLHNPLGLAIDSNDQVYIADTYNHAIRRVNADGTIMTVAGRGAVTGDGAAATRSALLNPVRIATDKAGALFIVEDVNDPPSARLRRVDENGIISTIAGNGLAGLAGDGGLASSASVGLTRGISPDYFGNVFLTDTANRVIRMLLPLRASQIRVAGGNNQRGPILSVLPEPLAVMALDERGIPVPGVAVRFRVVEGAASVPAEVVETDRVGVALAPLEIRGESGPIVVEAGVEGLDGIRFEAEAKPVSVAVKPEIQDYSISTIAGNATASAREGLYFDEPSGFAFDRDGVLYVADSGANAIRKIGPGEICVTIAGPKDPGYCQAPDQPALLRAPGGIAWSPGGDLYVADRLNHRVLKIDQSGGVTTFAGTGVPGFSGDDGPAVDARLTMPTFVLTGDAGAVFITDAGNRRVRRVSADGVITTIAGNGQIGAGGDGDFAINAPLVSPAGLALTAEGVLLIADSGTHEVKAVSPEGIIKIIAGIGRPPTPEEDRLPALSGALDTPAGLAVGKEGTIYVGERGRVRQITPGEPPVAIGSKESGNTLWLTFHAGLLHILDTERGVVRRVESNGSLTLIAGSRFHGDGGSAEAASLSSADGLVVDAAGNIYFSDSQNHRVRRIDTSGRIETIAGTGQPASTGDGGAALQAALDTPSGLAIHPDGSLYVAEYRGARIRRISTDGLIGTAAGVGLFGNSGDGGLARTAKFTAPSGLAIDADGNVFVSDFLANTVRKIAPNGVITRVVGTNQAGNPSAIGLRGVDTALNGPTALALDQAGNLLIADKINNRVLKLFRSGAILNIAGTGQRRSGPDGGLAVETPLNRPSGIALDRAGNLFVSDESQKIRKVSPTGLIVTVAGRGPAGFSGDGGPATVANLRDPGSIAVNGEGELYLSDRGNRRIRKLSAVVPK